MEKSHGVKVYRIEADFSNIKNQIDSEITASRNSYGEAQDFMFMLWANFERDTENGHMRAIPFRAKFQVLFNTVHKVGEINDTIPENQWSTTKNLGLFEIPAPQNDSEGSKSILVIEFGSHLGERSRREYVITYEPKAKVHTR